MRFKPRYSLATLLALITAAALLLWGIPEWREYLRRMEFEQAACQLTAGIKPNLFKALPQHAFAGSLTTSHFADANHNYVTCTPVYYKRHWYCIYAHEEELSKGEIQRRQLESLDDVRNVAVVPDRPLALWKQVRIYRLAPLPRSYQAQSERGKDQVIRHSNNQKVDRSPQEQYLTDFYEIIAGRERRDLGVQYELIHADPPLTAD